FAYIYSFKRQNSLLLWTAAWLVFGVHYISPAITQSAVSSALEGALTQWLFGLSALLFFLGAQIYAQRRCWKRRALAAAAVLGIWAAANAANLFSLSAIIPASLLYVAVAAIFWQESRRQETLADRLLGLSFGSWGVLWLGLHYLKGTPELQGSNLNVVATAPCAFVAMLMVMALYEEEKRRIERNMLALSNLNLATSSFVGGEIQRMLSQALDRVLGVVRLPAGALFLHHGDPQGPTSVVAVGLSDEFCRAAQNESLDDYLVSLVARLGGLLGFRDLRDDSLSALQKEDLTKKVWEELRRLFDVENFYIAELDSFRDELRFDLEIIAGNRVPRRTRPAGNHLTEYLIRTRQPVLIRENYVTEVKKLGVEPIRNGGCFCGVPLVAYDRAIGAMAVFSDHERAFDEGHLELLRVLASEASIAIENARLFYEERTKARHLSLLNTISRNAIATLN